MDPTQQPQPMVPGMSAGAPTAAPAGLSQEQMKANLQGMMSKIEGKYQDFNSHKFAAANQTTADKSSSLRQLFDLFQSMGVDPSDPAALKQFLAQLQQSNPQMYQQVVDALEAMLGDSPQDTPQTAGTTPTAIANDAPINNMNIDPANAQPTV